MKAHPLFLSVIFLFISCERDTDNIDDEDWVNVTYVTPVYQTASAIAEQVTVEDLKEQTSLGKIITYQNYVFVNEPMEGVHIVDNSDPSNPTNLSFLSIPGNLDISIIDDYLFIDMFSSLAVFDISDLSKIQENNLIEAVKSGVSIAGAHGGLVDAFRKSTNYQFLLGANG